MTPFQGRFFQCYALLILVCQGSIMSTRLIEQAQNFGVGQVFCNTLEPYNKPYKIIRHANRHKKMKNTPPAIELRKRPSSLTTLYQRC